MTDSHNTPIDTQDLRERLSLIETMMSEGRQKTESWGWSFVLWGIAYYVATAWATLGHSFYAWPVTMIAAAAITGFGAFKTRQNQPGTTLGRAVGAIWIAMGWSLFILCFSAASSGHAEQHLFLAMIEGALGTANVTSGLILRWRVQMAVGVAWWVAASASCFVTIDQSGYIFLAAIFLCQVAFGVYMMISEAAERRTRAANSGASHA
jgi:hypothetical protein